MRSWVPLLALAVIAAPARAEEYRGVGGVVVDATTGAAVAGALVTADDAIAESGADGAFRLAGVKGRRVAIFVFAEGYAPAEAELTERVPGRIQLHRDRAAIEIIEVSGKAPDQASPTSYSFNREQIRALPGSGNDVLRALQSMPGVSRTAYGVGGLVLRGASPHETSIYLDGIEVPLAYHLGGISSFYPSTLLEDIALSPGGGDVAFGRGVGGVVEIRSRRGREDGVRVGAELGIFDASAYGESAAAGGGVTLGVRRSYADAFLREVLPEETMVVPRYYDGQLRWDRAAAGGNLTVYGFFSDDRVLGWGGTDFHQGFARTAVRWQRQIGRTSLTILPWAGIGRTDVRFVQEHTDEHPDLPQVMRLDRHPIGLRGELRRDTGWGHVAGGVDVQGAYVEMTQPLDDDSLEHVSEDGTYLDAGVWMEARWRIEDGKLTIKTGLRADYLGIADSYVLEPRVVTTHELTSWLTLRESFAYQHQPLGPASAINWDRALEQALSVDLFDPTGMVVQGIQTSVGARVALPASVIASVTGYHVQRRGKKGAVSGLDLVKLLDGLVTNDLPFENGLNLMLENVMSEEFGGSAYNNRRGAGVEVSLQRRTDRWLMWLSYTLAVSQQHPIGPTDDRWSPNDMDQTHNLNMVASVHLRRGWQLGARFRYTTGLPYHPRVGYDESFDVPIHGPPNSARLPDYLSLDLRLDRRWHRGWGTLGFFLDIQNLTNSRNPEGVNYEGSSIVPEFQRGLPILPMLGFSYEPPS